MGLKLPALRFEAEAFQLGKEKILGRQSAGAAFLRAVLDLPELTELTGYGPSRAAMQAFGQIVGANRRDVAAKWLAPGASDGLAAQGMVHFPDPVIGEQARQRLGAGAAAWSISQPTRAASMGAQASGKVLRW